MKQVTTANDRQPKRATKVLKTGTLAITAAALLAAYGPAAPAATITTFAQLDALTETGNITVGTNAGSPPTGASDTADFTFDFTMTTPGSFSGTSVLVDFGGKTVGTSLILANDRLVFRSGGEGPDTMLYVTSIELSASTSYRVTGSLFMNSIAGSDEMRLYLNETDAVDAAFDSNHNPAVDMGGDWTGGNAYGYGSIASGGDVLVGTPSVPDGTGSISAFPGTLNSNLVYYNDTFLNVPEPGSLALLGLGGLCLFRRRRG